MLNFNKIIEKWLRGDFRRSDEAVLRDLAAKDSFAKAAAEGYYASPEENHAAHLENIRKKLSAKYPPTVHTTRAKTIWWSMAAAFFLFIACVWFFTKDGFQDKAEIAQAMEQSAPTDAASATAAQVEMAVEENTANGIEFESTGEKTDKLATENSKNQKNASKFGKMDKPLPNSAAQHTPSPTVTKANVDALRTVAANDAKAATAKMAQRPPSQVATETPQPTVSPTRSEKIRTQQGYAGKDYGQSAQNVGPVTTPSPATKKEKADKEVAFQTDRKLADSATSSPESDDMSLNPAPATGWEAFRRYLRVNAQLTPEALNNNITGTVRLRFQINQDGEPVNINILQSLGYGCDEEAIRLIREGGIWDLGQSNFITVDVPFVR